MHFENRNSDLHSKRCLSYTKSVTIYMRWRYFVKSIVYIKIERFISDSAFLPEGQKSIRRNIFVTLMA